MNRRNFLIGAGGTAIGGAALVGSSAFSRVESHRAVSVAVANDANAYLGLLPGDSPNGANYVEEDDSGHIEIEIGEIPDEENPIGGSGVNSNSLTFFDNLITVCNQGKEDAGFSIDAEDLTTGDAAVVFYVGTAAGAGERAISPITSGVEGFEPAALELGECLDVGLLVDTGAGSAFTDADTVDATQDGPLVAGEVRFVADVDAETGEPIALLSDLDIGGQGAAASVEPAETLGIAARVTNAGRRPGAFDIVIDVSRELDRADILESLFETGTEIDDDDVDAPPNTKIGFGQVEVNDAYDALTAD